MINPIKEIREKEGLTRAELSIKANMGYSHLSLVEAGAPKKVPSGLLTFLKTKGYNTEEVEQQYMEFRKLSQAM